MRNLIKNVIVVLGLILISFSLIAASIVKNSNGDAPTIFANPTFPNQYTLKAGQTYPQGYADLTYKMMNVPGQVGMYGSYEQSILFIEIINVTGLPAGLQYTQDVNSRNPLSNGFYLFGTIPADVTPGVYTVTITGKDGAVPANTADQIIYLTIGTEAAPPTPNNQTPQISGNVGEQPPLALPPLNLPLTNYFTSSVAIDGFKTVGATDPASFGISLDATSGNFSGTYTQAGTYTIQVEAHNIAGWSAPLSVIFSISAPPVPVNQTPDLAGNIGDSVPVNLPPLNSPLNQYFVSSLPIDSFQLTGGDDPQSFGLTFVTSTGNFSGVYTQAGTFAVKVAAHNSAGWSAALPVTFTISAPPTPLNEEPSLSGNVGDAVPVNLPPLNTPVSQYFTSALPIDSYKLAGGDNPQTFGLTFDTGTGNFTGTYTQEGSFTVQVSAHNKAGWSSPLTINFAINQPPIPNTQTPRITGTINDTVPIDLPPFNTPLSSYFKSSLPIDTYKIIGTVDPGSFGLQFNTSSGNFSGTYTQAGLFAVQVAAHNSAGWSIPLTVNFLIADIPPPPTAATLLCPTTTDLGQGIPPQTYTVHDSIGNSYILELSPRSVGMLNTFYGASITVGTTQNTLACDYTSGSTVGPSITYLYNALPTNSYITDGNNCMNQSGPEGCVINIPPADFK